MSLPRDHSCDNSCDYDDSDHRKLRKRLQERNTLKAEVKADQAWAKARDMLPDLLITRSKLDGDASITEADIELMRSALSLGIGEIYLREAQIAKNEYR